MWWLNGVVVCGWHSQVVDLESNTMWTMEDVMPSLEAAADILKYSVVGGGRVAWRHSWEVVLAFTYTLVYAAASRKAQSSLSEQM